MQGGKPMVTKRCNQLAVVNYTVLPQWCKGIGSIVDVAMVVLVLH